MRMVSFLSSQNATENQVKSSNLFMYYVFFAKRPALKSSKLTRTQEKKSKEKVKNSVFAAFSQTESVLNGVLRALCACTCKAAKLRMNTLNTGYTIMRASGNELLSFIFR